MTIKILSPREQADIYPEVLEMLEEADGDFVPPLSARSSATQQELSGVTRQNDGVRAYFAQLQTQRFAAVYDGGRVIGFVSFREDYTCPQIPRSLTPNIYLSTLIVRPEARGKGVTTALYGVLFDRYAGGYIFTRTWSTNEAHIRVLKKYGFVTWQVLPDHRGPGIDTVYFMRQPTVCAVYERMARL